MNASTLLVEPGPPLGGEFTPPGDKSITHRAWLLALVADGEYEVTGANPGADCEGTLAAVRRLGVAVRETPHGRSLVGAGGALVDPGAPIDCGNSGTTLRLLAGILATQPFRSVLTGDASLVRRPVARIIEPLRRMGATLTAEAGDRLPPLVIRGGALRGIHYAVPVASAQVASCVLFAGLGASGATVVDIPGPARDHTERLLRATGVALDEQPLANGGRSVRIPGGSRPRAVPIAVPGDVSAAAFFLAAAAASPGASVTARGVNLNPTRTGLLDLLERMGARVERAHVRLEAGEEVGDVTVLGPAELTACDVPVEWLPRLIDEVPAWTIAASAARGVSRLRGAAELRVKESDRIAALARGLAAMGIEATEHPDGIDLRGGAPRGGRVAAEEDHRIAMTFAVLATRAAASVRIDEAGGIATSYPGFAAALTALGGRVRPE